MSRPFIHVNFATAGGNWTSDAKASISCDADWQRVHILREQYDAVAVGGRTWNSDQPRLTVRRERLGREPQRQPARVVFAGAHYCRVQEQGDSPAFLIGATATQPCGATVIASHDRNLLPPLECLYRYGIRSMLVEGGPTLLYSFFKQGLADAVTIFVRTEEEEAGHEMARMALPGLTSFLQACRFGEGFLFACGQNPFDRLSVVGSPDITGRSE